jgi:translation initiation factor 2 subunit 1
VDISKILLKDYEYIYHAFEDVVSGSLNLVEAGIDKKIASEIEELANQRFKPQSVEIHGVLSLTSYESNGLETVKTALVQAKNASGAEIRYLGGGKYKISVTAMDYKEAEPKLKIAVDTAIEIMEKSKGIGEFTRK